MNQLIVRAAAQQDVRAIREWYEGEEEGLGAQFSRSLMRSLIAYAGCRVSFPKFGRD